MQLEIGKIYDGKVKGIAQYGAFVEIEGAGTGMVHISEIANSFVKDVKKKPPVTELGFEEMLTRFKQNSEEKICALKRNTERKNGSRRK